jgi:hypothetical protein
MLIECSFSLSGGGGAGPSAAAVAVAKGHKKNFFKNAHTTTNNL